MADRFNSSLSAVVLGRRLHVSRKQRHLTLLQVAEATGVHHGQISRIERGGFATNSANVQKLCTFLQIADTLNEQSTQSVSPAALKGRLDRLLQAVPESGPLLWAVLDAMELAIPAA